ncbi:MAG: cytochrome c3 family protein [Bacteroidota bacterium]
MNSIQLFLLIWFYGLGLGSPQRSAPKTECLDCHKPLISQTVMHAVAESCDNCHTSNGKEHPQKGVAGFTFTEAVPAMCYTCHDKVLSDVQKSKDLHGAILTKRSCVACHSPHSSAQEKLLVAQDKDLCLGCHNRIIATDSTHTDNIKQLLDKSQYVHGAIEGGGCLACHSPHASNNFALLRDVFPQSIYAEGKPENYALCFSCHDNQLMSTENTTTATQFRDGNHNLHYLHLHGIKGRSCTLCHNVHASANPHLINDVTVFGKWEMPIRYKPLEKGGSCYPGCHGEKSYSYGN